MGGTAGVDAVNRRYYPRPRMMRNRFMLGVILIGSSSAIGWIALGLGSALTVRYGNIAFKIGLGINLLSWIPFGIGFWLSGREGVNYSKEFFAKIFRKPPPAA